MTRSIRLLNRFLFITGLFLAVSEVCKQVLLTCRSGHYLWYYFPFQLCSIPMYLLPFLPLLKGEKRRTVLAFLCTFSLLGGMAAFLDTSGMHYSLPLLTAHSYLWHILLVFAGLASGICLILEPDSGQKKNACLPWRTFFHTLLLYGVFCFVAMVLNLLFSPFGAIDLFYINPLVPMVQMVFRDIGQSLGNTAAILVYLGATVLGSTLLYGFWRGAASPLAEHPQNFRHRR